MEPTDPRYASLLHALEHNDASDFIYHLRHGALNSANKRGTWYYEKEKLSEHQDLRQLHTQLLTHRAKKASEEPLWNDATVLFWAEIRAAQLSQALAPLFIARYGREPEGPSHLVGNGAAPLAVWQAASQLYAVIKEPLNTGAPQTEAQLLFQACAGTDMAFIHGLLDAGANPHACVPGEGLQLPNTPVRFGDTLLHVLARNSHSRDDVQQLLQSLISEGLDVDARNNEGHTPLDVARPQYWSTFIQAGATIPPHLPYLCIRDALLRQADALWARDPALFQRPDADGVLPAWGWWGTNPRRREDSSSAQWLLTHELWEPAFQHQSQKGYNFLTYGLMEPSVPMVSDYQVSERLHDLQQGRDVPAPPLSMWWEPDGAGRYVREAFEAQQSEEGQRLLQSLVLDTYAAYLEQSMTSVAPSVAPRAQRPRL